MTYARRLARTPRRAVRWLRHFMKRLSLAACGPMKPACRCSRLRAGLRLVCAAPRRCHWHLKIVVCIVVAPGADTRMSLPDRAGAHRHLPDQLTNDGDQGAWAIGGSSALSASISFEAFSSESLVALLRS